MSSVSDIETERVMAVMPRPRANIARGWCSQFFIRSTRRLGCSRFGSARAKTAKARGRGAKPAKEDEERPAQAGAVDHGEGLNVRDGVAGEEAEGNGGDGGAAHDAVGAQPAEAQEVEDAVRREGFENRLLGAGAGRPQARGGGGEGKSRAGG